MAQGGNQGVRKDQVDDKAEVAKRTQQRREPPGTGQHQTDNNARHWWRATACSGLTKPRLSRS